MEICLTKITDTCTAAQYLLNEVSHFHLRPLLGHVSLYLGVCVIDDGQEHVLHRKREKRSEGHIEQHEQQQV